MCESRRGTGNTCYSMTRFTRQGCPEDTPSEMIRYTDPIYLRRWIGKRASKDVRVAKCRRASLLRRRLRSCGIQLSCRSPGVNCRAVGCVSHVVPDPSTVSVGRDSIHIVTKELQKQVVLARAARISGRATVQFTPRTRRSICTNVRVLHHAYQRARAGGIIA